MESLVLNPESKNQIIEYIGRIHLMKYEAGIMDELLSAVEKEALSQLTYLNSFGDCFRAITMNLYAYRKGLEFGFTEIAFSQHGWFERPYGQIQKNTLSEIRAAMATIVPSLQAEAQTTFGLTHCTIVLDVPVVVRPYQFTINNLKIGIMPLPAHQPI